jgi:anti-anti-sigma regulatory factor
MARIRVIRQHLTTRVVVAGHLSAADTRRLEHACSPALTSPTANLVLDLTEVSDVDNVAAALVGRMASRGAIVRRSE